VLRGVRNNSALLLLFLSAGCTKPEAYYEVFREQRATYREVTKILGEIQDEKSMAQAKAKLQDQFEKLEATARKAEALPKQPPAEVVERFRDESQSLQRAINDMREQVGRVQKLEGGQAFFKQFESNHSGLFNAVQP
jgi:DNA-directed RNA polymerase alpha subunit